MGGHHHMAVGLLWQQVHFFFVGFCYVLKQTERKSGMPCMLQWRWVCLPRCYKEQVWEGSSKARGGKKLMSRVKSAREKKGEDRAEKVRGEKIDLAAFEYVRAAGSWQQEFEKHSLTNPPLWQMPDVSHHFPAFQFMVCWHTQESYFSIEGQPGPGTPVHTGIPSAGAARAQLPLASGELCHAGLQFATWIPDKNCLLKKGIWRSIYKSLPSLRHEKEHDKECRWLFQCQANAWGLLRIYTAATLLAQGFPCCAATAASPLVSDLQLQPSGWFLSFLSPAWPSEKAALVHHWGLVTYSLASERWSRNIIEKQSFAPAIQMYISPRGHKRPGKWVRCF